MIYYFAPMEGLTTYIYRNAHFKYFGGFDKYFTPFISTNQNLKFSSRDMNDILPENNLGVPLVPQILTNKCAEFIHAADVLENFGYKEVNLNLGCPSGTVVAKGKGSGFLGELDALNQFLETIFNESNLNISIKTRIGVDSPHEFEKILGIFNQYPVSELIVHPRIQKDFYKNNPRMESFEIALSNSKAPLCYNGDLFDQHDLSQFFKSYPNVSKVMLGRGALINPALALSAAENIELNYKILKDFHDELLQNYQSILSGDHNVLHKMKALWVYLIKSFPQSDKLEKKIRKSTRMDAYLNIVDEIFRVKKQIVINVCFYLPL